MIQLAVIFGFCAVGAAQLLCLWRVIRGPGMMDRILALDTMVINAIALIILYGIYNGTAIYFEASLLFAMFGFISTVALCRYLLRGEVIE